MSINGTLYVTCPDALSSPGSSSLYILCLCYFFLFVRSVVRRYIVDIYEYNNDLVVKAYDSLKCTMLRTHATAKQLCDWVKRADATQREERRRQRNRQRALANAHGNWARVMEIVKEQEKDDADLDEEPALLQKRNFPDLLKWVTRRLFVEKKIDMRGHEQSTLMLQYQVENRRRHVMAHRMQGMWRSFRARTKVSALRPWWSACLPRVPFMHMLVLTG